jgi:hypothetical protein
LRPAEVATGRISATQILAKTGSRGLRSDNPAAQTG